MFSDFFRDASHQIKGVKHETVEYVRSLNSSEKNKYLTQLNDLSMNLLMDAIYQGYCDVSKILAEIETLDPSVQAQIFTQADINGRNALMLACIYCQTNVCSLLEASNSLKLEVRERIYLQTDTNDCNALMLGFSHPKNSSFGILNLVISVKQLRLTTRDSIVIQTNTSGRTVLNMADSECSEELFRLLKTCSPGVRRQLYKSRSTFSWFNVGDLHKQLKETCFQDNEPAPAEDSGLSRSAFALLGSCLYPTRASSQEIKPAQHYMKKNQ